MSTDSPPLSDLDSAVPPIADLVALARSAADAAADYQRSIDRMRIDRAYKQNAHDIVTVHDKRSEAIIIEHLLQRLPSASILGEEGGSREGTGPVCFIVDPIDGTSNFAAGLPLFCISIGITVDDQLVGGVINAPILGQEFWSDEHGAYLNGERIGGHQTRPAQDALVLSGWPSARGFAEYPQIIEEQMSSVYTSVSAVRCLGTAALELAYVAAGWADATMLMGISPWDVAAGFHIVDKAGGSIRAWSGRPGDESDGGDLPLHMRPAYVACSGSDRIEVLDTLGEITHRFRTGDC